MENFLDYIGNNKESNDLNILYVIKYELFLKMKIYEIKLLAV